MSTKALVDRIQPYARGWSRTGTRSILDLIQKGQDLLFDQESIYSVYLGTDNKGFEPYLTTVDGTYKYDIAAANLTGFASLTKTIGGTAYTIRCKRVIRVFVDLSTTGYNKTYLGQPFIAFYENPYRVNSERVKCGEVAVRSYPALENTNAYLIFKENPGASTERYFVQFIYEPPRLSAETVPLCVPVEFEEALEEYAMGVIQKKANGKPNEYSQNFWNFWVPRWKAKSMAGAQDNNLEVQVLDFA